MRRATFGVAAASAALLFSACSTAAVPADPGANPSTATPSPSSTVTGPALVSTERWQSILTDLTGRGLDASTVQLVSAKEVTWPDGSLGCPQSGKVYTQALVRGFQVIVEVAGQRYDYHFGGGNTARLCTK